jgi:heme exporter protein A
MIRITKLIKNYGPHPVLRGVSLHVPRGEFLTLVGPNGAGKTTLLRIIATLGQATAGEVRVGGWPLPTAADRVRPHLGLISHQPLLYAELTAEENLRFFARMYGLAGPAGRIDEVLESVDLSGRRHDPVGEFSRGMQQRLAIARAILHQPEILLLDEPYTGLDQSAAAMLDEVLHSVATAGRTVVMTTHDLARGLANCDRIAILARGKIAFEAGRDEVDQDGFRQVYEQVTIGKRNG